MEGLGGLVAELPLPIVLVRESRPTLWEGFVVAGPLEGCQKGENKMKYSPCVNVLLYIYPRLRDGNGCAARTVSMSVYCRPNSIITKE